MGISLGKIKNNSSGGVSNDWGVCRIVIDSKYDTLILEADYDDSLRADGGISNPYKIYRCSLQDNNINSKCSYREW